MKICVNLGELNKAITALDACIGIYESKCKKIMEKVDSLNKEWQGSDYAIYKEIVDDLNSQANDSGRILNYMKQYLEDLKKAKEYYYEAREEVINLGKRI